MASFIFLLDQSRKLLAGKIIVPFEWLSIAPESPVYFTSKEFLDWSSKKMKTCHSLADLALDLFGAGQD